MVLCLAHTRKDTWRRALRLPGKEVANLSCSIPGSKGIRAPASSHKGTLYLWVQLSPHMTSASILPQPGPVCLPSWRGLAAAATALDGGGSPGCLGPAQDPSCGRNLISSHLISALITSFPVICRRGSKKSAFAKRVLLQKINLNSPAMVMGEPPFLPSLQFSHFPTQGHGSPSHIPPTEAEPTCPEGRCGQGATAWLSCSEL